MPIELAEPNTERPTKNYGFVVVAGTFEPNDQRNYKFIGTRHETIVQALREFQTVVNYPFRNIEFCDGNEIWSLDPRLIDPGH